MIDADCRLGEGAFGGFKDSIIIMSGGRLLTPGRPLLMRRGRRVSCVDGGFDVC